MELEGFKNDTLIFIVSILKYFTFWVIGLDLLYYFDYIKDVEITLIFLHILVLVSSYKFVNIYPKLLDIELYTKDKIIKYRFKDNELRFLDLLFHWMPFIILMIVLLRKKDKLKNNNFLNIIIPLFYYLTFDIKKLYKLNENELFYIFSLIYIIFYLAFN